MLAQQPDVTLCDRRSRGPGWPYKLYCMLHGRERGELLSWLDQARRAADLERAHQEILFSRRRFKQFVLTAVQVRKDRFEAVNLQVKALPAEAHNYRREHALNTR